MAGTYKITVDSRSLEALRRVGADLSDFSRPMAEYTTYLERETRLNFAREQDPEGKRWAELKPSTLARKQSGAILRETSTLVNSISSRSDRTSGTVEAGTDYALPLQRGTGRMPARQFMGVSEPQEQAGQRIFERWVGRLIADAG